MKQQDCGRITRQLWHIVSVAAQIAKFAEYYPDNARPDQPLNGRTVEHSK